MTVCREIVSVHEIYQSCNLVFLGGVGGGCFPCVKSSVPRRKDVEVIIEDPQSTNLHLRKFKHKHIS